MRFRRQDGRPSALFFGATGWLFADLLLALTILFLVANTFRQLPPPKPVCATTPPKPTAACVPPTPTTAPTPTPTPQPSPINLVYVPLHYKVDYGKLESQDPSTISFWEDKVKSDLAGKHVGLVITFGGVPSIQYAADGETVAGDFNTFVLEDLGSKGIIFPYPGSDKDYYYFAYHEIDPTFPLGTLDIHVYLIEGG